MHRTYWQASWPVHYERDVNCRQEGMSCRRDAPFVPFYPKPEFTRRFSRIEGLRSNVWSKLSFRQLGTSFHTFFSLQECLQPRARQTCSISFDCLEVLRLWASSIQDLLPTEILRKSLLSLERCRIRCLRPKRKNT